MDTVLIVARLTLALTFAVAAVAKAADMSGLRAALEGFKIPPSWTRFAAVGLPTIELTSAALLVIAPTAQLGAALACALLLVFIGGISAALRRGAQPDCHCFGQLHSRPAGLDTIARNGILAAVGLFVLIDGPGPGLQRWVETSDGDVLALAGVSLLAIVLAYACLTLWQDGRDRSGRADRSAPEPLGMGQSPPQFEAIDLGGLAVTSDDLLDDRKRTVLVFTSATCGPCVGLLPELARWQEALKGRLTIHVVASGDEAANRRLSEAHGMPMLLDQESAIMRAFGVAATPSAFAIDETGRILAPVAVGAASIEGLIRVALKRPAPAIGLSVHHVQPNHA